MYSLVREGNLDLLKTMNKSTFNERHLSIAAEHGHVEIVNLLLDSGVPKSVKARRRAAESGHIEIVKMLY